MQKLIQFLVILSVVLLSSYSTVALSVKSNSSDFIRVNPNNPYRFVDTRGKPFYPIGIGDCIGLGEAGSRVPVSTFWGFDGRTRPPAPPEGDRVNIDTYLSAYQNAGFNLFRWSIGNCSFNLDTEYDWSEGDLLVSNCLLYTSDAADE